MQLFNRVYYRRVRERPRAHTRKPLHFPRLAHAFTKLLITITGTRCVWLLTGGEIVSVIEELDIGVSHCSAPLSPMILHEDRSERAENSGARESHRKTKRFQREKLQKSSRNRAASKLHFGVVKFTRLRLKYPCGEGVCRASLAASNNPPAVRAALLTKLTRISPNMLADLSRIQGPVSFLQIYDE